VKRKILIVSIIIAVIIAVMIAANRKNSFVRQMQGPIEGTDRIVTVDNRLSVISKENYIYTWQWNDLSIWPVVAKPASNAVTTIADDRVIYAASGMGKLIIADFKADKELSSLSLPYGAECKKIKISSNGKFGIVSVIFNEGTQKDWLKLAVFDSDLKDLSFVFQKDTKSEKFSLYDFAVSNEGDLIAGAGQKEKSWVFVSNIKSGNILWEKTIEDSSKFANIIFSVDGKTVYAANSDRFVYVFDVSTGSLIRTLEMKKYPTSSTQLQTISCVTVSPDGRIFAAASQPSAQVYLWDTRTGKELYVIQAAREIPSGLAFSPDSSLLAVSDLVRSSINIFRIPKGL